MPLVFRIFAFVWMALAMTALARTDDAVRHYKVGDLDVMAMCDADMSMGKQLFPDLDKYPEFSGVFANGPVPGVLQTFYLKSGDRHALIDAGWGKELKVKGHTVELLRENGLQPGMITDIILTHMDHDHVGGLLEIGKPVYLIANFACNYPLTAKQVRLGIIARASLRGKPATACLDKVNPNTL